MTQPDTAPFPLSRPRRLRLSPAIRRLVAETSLSAERLVLPLFVRSGRKVRHPVNAMPGVHQLSIDELLKDAATALEAGVGTVLLFGIPDKKDELGTGAYAKNGIVQRAVKELKRAHPGLVIITDVCLCEYTSHGHCGMLQSTRYGKTVANDPTLKLLAAVAVSHAEAGTDIVAPSDMMDGRVAAIRSALDQKGFSDLPILSYAAKFASAFYGPFRDAAESTPRFGDRRSYQMDPATAVYSVSGEYSMIKAAAANGWINERAVTLESLLAMRRAGADILITYSAVEAAKWLREG
jgi:porphobilinogen synthase